MTESRAALVTLISVLGFAAFSASGQIETFRTTHYNWGYPVFFVHAPDELAGQMRSAVSDFCAANKSNTGQDPYEQLGDFDWLCLKNELQFFRGVTGTGDKLDWGYVCTGKIGLPNQKYFSDQMLREWSGSHCVQVPWDDESGKYDIKLPGDA